MNTLTDISLADTVAAVSSARDLGYALADFVDRFNREPDTAMLEQEPSLLATNLNDDGLADAYLAASAAWLCRQHQLPVPKWAQGTSRALRTPWYAAKTPNLRSLLLEESPAEFRSRNIFVSANALARA